MKYIRGDLAITFTSCATVLQVQEYLPLLDEMTSSSGQFSYEKVWLLLSVHKAFCCLTYMYPSTKCERLTGSFKGFLMRWASSLANPIVNGVFAVFEMSTCSFFSPLQACTRTVEEPISPSPEMSYLIVDAIPPRVVKSEFKLWREDNDVCFDFMRCDEGRRDL